MDVEVLRKALHAHPFEPFEVVMSGGEKFAIKQPDWLSVPPGTTVRSVTAYTPDARKPGEFRMHWVDPQLVLKLVKLPQPAAPPPGPPENPKKGGG